MTESPSNAIKALRDALAAGPTPGPWLHEASNLERYSMHVTSEAGGKWPYNTVAHIPEMYGEHCATPGAHMANARLICACSPERIRALLDYVQGLEDKAAFYRRRCDALQEWQSKMRDPERTIVCDIIANGHTLHSAVAGDRYKQEAKR